LRDTETDCDDQADARGRQRQRGLAIHFAGYIIVVSCLFAVNFLWLKGEPFFVLLMVVWGSVLALHVAWVMGLFDGLFGNK
jgi:hypothetical protein